MSSDHCCNCSRFSPGTPIISAITVAGSGYEKSRIKSISPRGSTHDNSSSTISAMRDRIRATTCGVNALFTSMRNRVWSGGSVNTIHKLNARPRLPIVPRSASDNVSIRGAMRADENRKSRKNDCTCAYRVSTQPPNTSLQWTGSSICKRRNTGYGFANIAGDFGSYTTVIALLPSYKRASRTSRPSLYLLYPPSNSRTPSRASQL